MCNKTMRLTKEQQKLFDDNIKLAEIKANTWIIPRDSYYSRGDLLTFAYQGLVIAAQTYNPDRECSFRTYATNIIKHEMMHGVEYYIKLHEREDSIDMSQLLEGGQNSKKRIQTELYSQDINKIELDLAIEKYLSYCDPTDRKIFTEVIINDRSRTDVAKELNVSTQVISVKVREMQKEIINFLQK